jgi:hypothetical protein
MLKDSFRDTKISPKTLNHYKTCAYVHLRLLMPPYKVPEKAFKISGTPEKPAFSGCVKT